MSTQQSQDQKGGPTLSEKALRLLAAHDREVAQFRRDQTRGPAFLDYPLKRSA